jgi:hypothetical protein
MLYSVDLQQTVGCQNVLLLLACRKQMRGHQPEVSLADIDSGQDFSQENPWSLQGQTERVGGLASAVWSHVPAA